MVPKSEKGQAVIFVALGIVMLLGFLGLGIDMGVLRYERRLQQTAADAAAVAGANNLKYGGTLAGGQNAAGSNGFTATSNNISDCSNTAALGTVCVQINNPPAAATVNGVTVPAGPHNGDAAYVEAIVATVQPTYFMQIFGVTKETVWARAVATNVSGGGPNTGCLYTLGAPQSKIEGVNIVGHADLNAPTCGIADNGNFDPKGGALTITANTFGVSGSCTGNGPGCSQPTCTSGQNPCPTYGMPAAADPLAYLTPPPVGTPANFVPNSSGPGTYNGISLTGNTNVNFAPGIYVLTGDFTCHGTPTITGTGVMFYFTNQSTFNCSGNDTINFTAPSPTNCPACPSQYDGILFYQDPTDTNGASVGGNTGTTYNGVMYFPGSEITFFGHNTSIATAIVVADSVGLNGTPVVNLQGTAGLPPGVTIASNTILVE